jgi:glycolate oxidase
VAEEFPLNELLQALNGVLHPDNILSEAADLRPYGFDGTAGLKEMPLAVVFPTSTAEVQAIVRLAQQFRVPLVSRGSGTGLSGGSVPVKNSIVVCLVKMDRILEVDTANLVMWVEPGVLTSQIDAAARQVGLFYPPDPGSMKISTIGGNVANNSGGLRGLKYGVTRNYVMGLEVVLPSGEITTLGNACVKDVAGYSLRDLFIGSEGTLGIITKILLRLLPPPAAKRTLVATYASIEAAAQTVSSIIAAKIIPCTLEFLDQETIRCVEAHAKIGLPVEAGAMLLMETDGHAAVVDEEAGAMERIAREEGATEVRLAQTNEEAEKLATARRAAFSALARVGPTTILEDTTVPRSRLAEMVRGVQEIARRYDLRIANFGHMGDGNLHPTILTDERDEAAMAKVEEAMREIFQLAIDLGGTISGEHGIGLAKMEFLPHQFDAGSFTLMRALKQTIDPHNLLNPGKIFD